LGKKDIRNLLFVLLVTVRSASSTPFAGRRRRFR
jgi:hypothetical protein